MSALDVCRMVHSLRQTVLNTWVQNIYDLNSKTFQFKLNRLNEKQVLIIEAGVRFHLTLFNRPKSNFPSGFSIKLRKHLRGTKLVDIEQIGFDRMIKLTFGKVPNQYFLFIELYSSGNIILTASDNSILAALRYHDYGETKIAVNEKLSFEITNQELPTVTLENLNASLNSYFENLTVSTEKFYFIQILSNKSCRFSGLGKDIISHFLKEREINPKESLTQQGIRDLVNNRSDSILEALALARAQFETELSQSEAYVSVAEDETYDSFECFKVNSHDNYITFDSLSEALDEYYSKIESNRIKTRTKNFEKQAMKKVQKVEKEQKARILQLSHNVEDNRVVAHIILKNVEVIDQAMIVIRSCIANQMSWDKIVEVVENEKKNKNSIASIIRKVKLDSNEVEVQFKDVHGQMILFPVDLNLSAHANATQYFSKKKKAASSVVKTQEVADRLIGTAKDKALKQVEDNKEKSLRLVANVGVVRKTFWFEKFYWFFTKQGFLVLAGRDSAQNEMLVKRFLRKGLGDIFVHADLHGASTCIVRNKQKDSKIDPESMKEAGRFAVNRSSAWSAKVPAGSYYVKAEQVSKTAPSGEYLTQGSFVVRGKRTYLAPEKLEMSFGYIFKLDETQPSFSTRNCDWKPIDYQSDNENNFLEDVANEKEIVIGNVVLAKTKHARKSSVPYYEVKTEKTIKKAVANVEQLPRGKRNKVKRLMKKYKHKTEAEKREIFDKFMFNRNNDKEDFCNNESPQEGVDFTKRVSSTLDLKTELKFNLPPEPKITSDEVNLPGFTCKPLAADELLYAIPVCGPYSSFSNYKYKVKLIPGTAKKGKSIRLINSIFSDQKNRVNKEVALIQAIDENHCIQCLPNNMKVSSSASAKILKKQKNSKKKRQ